MRLRAPLLLAVVAPLVAAWAWWVGAGPRSVVLRDAPDAQWIRHILNA